jgi:hypothetical protein
VQESNKEGSCVVANTCSKAFGFLFQLVVPLKSIIVFVSNLN